MVNLAFTIIDSKAVISFTVKKRSCDFPTTQAPVLRITALYAGAYNCYFFLVTMSSTPQALHSKFSLLAIIITVPPVISASQLVL